MAVRLEGVMEGVKSAKKLKALIRNKQDNLAKTSRKMWQ